MKQCPSCHRMYDDSLKFCLEDGSTLTEPYDSGATLIGRPGRRTDARTEVLPVSVSTAEIPSRPKTPWTNYVIIALLALIAGGGVVWLLRGTSDSTSSDNSRNSSTSPTTSPSRSAPANNNSAAPGPQGTVPAANVSTPPRPSGGWFVILGSFPKDRRDAAEVKLQAVKDDGWFGKIIDTNDYPGLSPGYWAVVVEADSESEANQYKSRLRTEFPDAYVKAGR